VLEKGMPASNCPEYLGEGISGLTIRGRIYIGTSGWHYGHWKGVFYPEYVHERDLLAYYSTRFGTVEINNTFYRLPEKDTFEQWRESVSGDFVFAVKASRYITHMKKLRDAAEPVNNFLESTGGLGKRLGPILFQLPPRWKANPGRLEEFLGLLPKGRRYAFEFRDHSWLCDEIYGILSEHGAACCIYDLDGYTSPETVTADFVYVRLHGPAGPYMGRYGRKALSGWADAFNAWTGQGRDVYCYFDNDENGYAALDAAALLEMTGAGPVAGVLIGKGE